MLAKNRSGWTLMEYIDIREDDIDRYPNVTGAYAILRVADKYVVGYNAWRRQWEFPAGGIEEGETAREAALRELYEESHQRSCDLEFKGLFKVEDAKGNMKYQAVFVGWQNEIVPFVPGENDEMEEIIIFICYVARRDISIVKSVQMPGLMA